MGVNLHRKGLNVSALKERNLMGINALMQMSANGMNLAHRYAQTHKDHSNARVFLGINLLVQIA